LQQNQQGPLASVMDTAKKMAAIGAGLMLGAPSMALGFDGGPNLENTLDAKSQQSVLGALDSRPPLANPATTANMAAAPAPITNVYITIQAPAGIDAQELAKLVQAEIGKAQRGADLRSRAQLSDRE
jgi:hypothetical protein